MEVYSFLFTVYLFYLDKNNYVDFVTGSSRSEEIGLGLIDDS